MDADYSSESDTNKRSKFEVAPDDLARFREVSRMPLEELRKKRAEQEKKERRNPNLPKEFDLLPKVEVEEVVVEFEMIVGVIVVALVVVGYMCCWLL